MRITVMTEGMIGRGEVSISRCVDCDQRKITVYTPSFMQLDWWEGYPLPEDTLFLFNAWVSRSGLTWKQPAKGACCDVVNVINRKLNTGIILRKGTILKVVPEQWADFFKGWPIYIFRDRQPVKGWLKDETDGVMMAKGEVSSIYFYLAQSQEEVREVICVPCLEKRIQSWDRQGHLFYMDHSGDEADFISRKWINKYGEVKGNKRDITSGDTITWFNHVIEIVQGSLAFWKQEDSRRSFIDVQGLVKITSPDHPNEDIILLSGRYFLYHPWPQKGQD